MSYFRTCKSDNCRDMDKFMEEKYGLTWADTTSLNHLADPWYTPYCGSDDGSKCSMPRMTKIGAFHFYCGECGFAVDLRRKQGLNQYYQDNFIVNPLEVMDYPDVPENVTKKIGKKYDKYPPFFPLFDGIRNGGTRIRPRGY